MAKAKEYALNIEVPEFDEKAAYDQDRPISSLIRTQLLHLHTAEHLVLPPGLRTDININDLHTEHHASEYIQKVTAALHRHGKTEARKAGTGGQGKARKKTVKKSGGKAAAGKTRKTSPAAKKRKPRK
jgi:hypothetical protein